jgi:hypothetical protein
MLWTLIENTVKRKENSQILLRLGALMVEVWIGTMALQNLQQYGCQSGNKLKEKSCDLKLEF